MSKQPSQLALTYTLVDKGKQRQQGLDKPWSQKHLPHLS